MKFTLQPFLAFLAPALWWILPILIVPLLLLGYASPYAGVVGVILMFCATFVCYRIVLKERVVPSRSAITVIILLSTFATGLLNLFLEDILFQSVIIAVLAFTHGYTLLHIRNSLYTDEKQLPQLVVESIRLHVLVGVFSLTSIAFGVIFYFAVEHAIAMLPIAILAIGVLFWSLVSFYGMQWRNRLLVTALYLIITIECIITLLWLPLSYMVSGAFLTIVLFVYDEAVVRFGHRGDMRHHDHKASFLMLITMVVLIIVISNWK